MATYARKGLNMSLIVSREFVPVTPLTKEQIDAVYSVFSRMNSSKDFSILFHCDSPDCGCETWYCWDEKCDYGDTLSLVDLIRKGLNAEFTNTRITRGQILTAVGLILGHTPNAPRCDYDDADEDNSCNGEIKHRSILEDMRAEISNE